MASQECARKVLQSKKCGKGKDATIAIAHEAIQCNAFYAHPGCILKSMLADEDQTLQERAVQKIMQLRAESGHGSKAKPEEDEGPGEEDKEEDEELEEEVEEGNGGEAERLEALPGNEAIQSLQPLEIQALEKAKIRKYVVPRLNFQAEVYPDLINWENAFFTEPPITASFTDNNIRGLVMAPLKVP